MDYAHQTTQTPRSANMIISLPLSYTSYHASIHPKVSSGFGDRALVTPPHQKFKLLIILLDSRVPVGLPERTLPNSPTIILIQKLYSSGYYIFRDIAILPLKSDN